MKNYFPPKYEFSLPYFRAAEMFTPELLATVREKVDAFLVTKKIVHSYYDYVVKTTLNHIDVTKDEGVFYCIHLNAYLRETSHVIWNYVNESPEFASLDSKKKDAKANALVAEFLTLCKDNFVKPPKVKK